MVMNIVLFPKCLCEFSVSLVALSASFVSLELCQISLAARLVPLQKRPANNGDSMVKLEVRHFLPI